MKVRHLAFISRQKLIFFSIAAALAIVAGGLQTTHAQITNVDRERGRSILRTIKLQIQEHYYDRTFKGIDLEARFKEADEALKSATSNGDVFGIIGQALVDLNDSHTTFIPPGRAQRTEYGWSMQIIGSRCFIVAVRPKSDAEAKGLKVGDELMSLNGFEPSRDNLWKMQYAYYALWPQAAMKLLVKSPGGQPRELIILSKITMGKRLLNNDDFRSFELEAQTEAYLTRHRYYENMDGVFIWKMPQFDLTEGQVDDMMNKVAKHRALILDLRGNGGGYVDTLQRLVSNIFDRDIKIGEVKRRNESKPYLAKTRGEKAFKGELVVLVDSASGSASEVFARVVQLEKRGVVLGDITAGAVMRSKIYPLEHGTEQRIYYALSITDADIIMTDGKSLEHVGVVPDEKLLMSGLALATFQDPVLSIAAAKVGLKLDPKKAGSLFPIEWESK
jgi:carboxyl-terminal processing protease